MSIPVFDQQKYLNNTLETNVTRSTLRKLVNLINPNRKTVLVGFNDYSKHLINLFPEHIVAVLDKEPCYEGLSFRNKNVISKLDNSLHFDEFIICNFDYIPYYLGELKSNKKYSNYPIKYSNDYNGLITRDYSMEHQSDFYKNLFTSDENLMQQKILGASMMDKDNIVFLIELLRSCLHLDGDIAEIGVWQGGSAYFIARTLEILKLNNKDLFLFDFFEEHESKHPKGIMCLSELKRLFDFYRKTTFVSGDIRKTIKQLENRRLAFVHYDMGFQKPILDVVVQNLAKGGIILFDNYGHVAANPVMFDKYVEQFNLRCCRIPYTAQAVLFNNV